MSSTYEAREAVSTGLPCLACSKLPTDWKAGHSTRQGTTAPERNRRAPGPSLTQKRSYWVIASPSRPVVPTLVGIAVASFDTAQQLVGGTPTPLGLTLYAIQTIRIRGHLIASSAHHGPEPAHCGGRARKERARGRAPYGSSLYNARIPL